MIFQSFLHILPAATRKQDRIEEAWSGEEAGWSFTILKQTGLGYSVSAQNRATGLPKGQASMIGPYCRFFKDAVAQCKAFLRSME